MPDSATNVKESVFACPVKDSTDGRSNLFYISKEYNVNSSDMAYKAGRFVFAPSVNIPPFRSFVHLMLLAEEPAQAYTSDRFHVESYYLQIRSYIQMGIIIQV